MEYEAIVCFETHVELGTRTKLFCRCSTAYGAPPNSRICPVCTGQPGALPVLNKKAVELCVRAGKALHCTINPEARFARKNYFYPDLPKGYQVSQYEQPLCEDGHLEITGDDGQHYAVGIRRIHLEEDAGKLVHPGASFEESLYSLVDYNRSGVPLLEIVADHTRSPLRSVQEARTYLEKLRQTLRYIDVSDCAIEKGQFRCDVNVSLRPRGSLDYGNRTEIKNLASFKSIVDAVDCEIARQRELLRSGRHVVQETRLYDEAKKMTRPMRGKEDAPDYRYFPDPDLLPVEIDQVFVREIERDMPELPEHTVSRLTDEFGLPLNEALLLAKDKHTVEFFLACAEQCEERTELSRWIIKEVFKLRNRTSTPLQGCPVEPAAFSDLINRVSRGEITETTGREVLDEMCATGNRPAAIIEARHLAAIRDTVTLQKVVNEVIQENPHVVSKIAQGNTKPMRFLIGQGMKKTKGRADPKRMAELMQKALGT